MTMCDDVTKVPVTIFLSQFYYFCNKSLFLLTKLENFIANFQVGVVHKLRHSLKGFNYFVTAVLKPDKEMKRIKKVSNSNSHTWYN